jgi:protein-tyrosine phosphatase
VTLPDDPELERPDLDIPVVLRDDDATVTLYWPGRQDEDLAILASPSPDPEGPKAEAGRLRNGRAKLANPRERRVFFHLEPTAGDRWIAAERRLPFEGHANFRDLGGYPGADGRRVRWGRLFRSGSLSALTEGDLRLIGSLDLSLVCDFRSPRERNEEPHRFPADSVPEQQAVNHQQLAGALNPDDIRKRIEEARLADLDTGSLLVDGNAAFATSHRGPFASMLELACDRAPRPLLVNCSAGKDRAGFASACLLLALGVPRAIVRHDYLLTNHFQNEERQDRMEQIRRYSMADPAALLPLFEARPGYIDAAFAAIDAEWGSDEAFLARGLGMSEEKLASLRSDLLL